MIIADKQQLIAMSNWQITDCSEAISDPIIGKSLPNIANTYRLTSPKVTHVDNVQRIAWLNFLTEFKIGMIQLHKSNSSAAQKENSNDMLEFFDVLQGT